MNDFTKDELIMLKRLALQNVNQFRENSDCIDLMSKIQSMIDNYCEHDEEKCGMKIEDIARSHFNEARSLIDHGLALLGIKNE
jgi:hypothetical protein